MSHRQQAPIRSFRDLQAWQTAMDLAIACYGLTKDFPHDERYGLTAQLRRSAVSIPSNIAEGRGRRGIGGFLYHLSVANGSLMELETQLLIAIRLRYIRDGADEAILSQLSRVRQLLAGLIRSLADKSRPRRIADTGIPPLSDS